MSKAIEMFPMDYSARAVIEAGYYDALNKGDYCGSFNDFALSVLGEGAEVGYEGIGRFLFTFKTVIVFGGAGADGVRSYDFIYPNNGQIVHFISRDKIQ